MSEQSSRFALDQQSQINLNGVFVVGNFSVSKDKIVKCIQKA